MSDYGAKLSLPGYDVQTIEDFLLQFSSSWPLLKISDTNTSSSTVAHNLGYPPFHIICSVSFVPGGVDQNAHEEWSVSSTQLVRASGTGSRRYFIFRLDLTENFTAQQLSGSSSASNTNFNYGLKLTKPGADINSTDLRDFSIHSSTRSPAVHMVDHGPMTNTGNGLGLERSINYNLDYSPLVFVFIRPDTNSLGYNANRYGIVPPPIGAASRYFMVDDAPSGTSLGGPGTVYVTADSSSFTGTPDVSIVVLKDPFEKEVINMSYP